MKYRCQVCKQIFTFQTQPKLEEGMRYVCQRCTTKAPDEPAQVPVDDDTPSLVDTALVVAEAAVEIASDVASSFDTGGSDDFSGGGGDFGGGGASSDF